MQLHQIQPRYKMKKKKRIGRGGKHGRYSGRGLKGQKARAGRKLAPVIREIIKKYPKLRGYRQKTLPKKEVGINLLILEKKFKTSEKVNPKILVQKKIIRKIGNKIPSVKILGKGKITKKLIIEKCQFSKQAKEKIEKVGGFIK